MLRWPARLRLRFPLLIACTPCCVLESAYAVGYSLCSGVAGNGCVWHISACSLYANCVRVPLYAIILLRQTSVSALSVSRLWCKLYDAAVSGAVGPALAAHSMYTAGYSLRGGFRLGCWIRWYLPSSSVAALSCTML